MKKYLYMVIACIMLMPLSVHAEDVYLYCNLYNSNIGDQLASGIPDVTVRTNFDLGTSISFNQLLIELITDGDAPDLFYLDYTNGQMGNLADRGYLQDLSGLAWVRKYYDEMPPMLQKEFCLSNGEIWCIPYYMEEIDCLFGFNTEVASKLGIKKPQTYEELFWLLDNWETYSDLAMAQGYSLVDNSFKLTEKYFLSSIINSYIACNYNENAISYGTEAFHAAMQTFDKYRSMISTLREKENIESKNNDPQNALIVTSGYPLLMDIDEEQRYGLHIEPLLLSITEDPQEAVIPVRVFTWSVYVNSSQNSIEMQLLKYLIENMSKDSLIMLQINTDNTPVENEQYPATMRYYEAMIAAIDAAIDTEGPMETLLIERDKLLREQQDCETLRYQYTTQSIDCYINLSKFIRVMPSISYEYYLSQPNTEYLLYRFEVGEMGMTDFVRQFEHMQSMMNSETE